MDQRCRHDKDTAAKQFSDERSDGGANQRGVTANQASGVAPPDDVFSCMAAGSAKEAQREPKQLPRHHPLAEPAVGDRRGQDRLQADDEHREAGRKAVLYGNEHAAEIEAVA